jgi:hypothetical protein
VEVLNKPKILSSSRKTRKFVENVPCKNSLQQSSSQNPTPNVTDNYRGCFIYDSQNRRLSSDISHANSKESAFSFILIKILSYKLSSLLLKPSQTPPLKPRHYMLFMLLNNHSLLGIELFIMHISRAINTL